MTVTASQSPVVLAIFVLTYAGLALGKVPGLKLSRTGIAILGAVAAWLVTRSSTQAIISTVSWPTILLLFGFFVVSAQLRLSGFYDRIAARVAATLDAPGRFLCLLVAMSAVLSAFLNNDIVCYALTPVVCAALLARKINPVPYLIALAASSNIGAGLTLIGNAQNMVIGQLAGLSFVRYLAWAAVPVLFGLAATYVVARMAMRPGKPVLAASDDGTDPGQPPYPFDAYHSAKGVVVLAVVIALFFTPLPREVIVLVAASIHLASTKFRTDSLLALVDWPVLLLFTALFVVSGAFEATGYGPRLVAWLGTLGINPSRAADEVALTAGLTVLINNAPAVMLLTKLVPMSHAAGYVMAAANSFGGNGVATASVANIIVVQQARRQGVAISFGAFARLGIPITLASLAGLAAWATAMGR
jgi:Na+/H+ antiporter NhaD/arsenite permease-like protein